MPAYRCKGKNCNFVTDDLGDFIRHVIREETSPPKPRRHKTARDYVECPECYPKLEKELLKRGWSKPEEKKEEKEKKTKQGLFG